VIVVFVSIAFLLLDCLFVCVAVVVVAAVAVAVASDLTFLSRTLHVPVVAASTLEIGRAIAVM